MGSYNGLNDTPLDPPLFWLDHTFKLVYAFICASSFHFLKTQQLLYPNVDCTMY
jgi:hypothetical protein